MEDNQENKSKFFSQYWGQLVYRHRTWTTERSWIVNSNCLDNYSVRSGFLALKNLPSITDEDAIACGMTKRKIKSYIQSPWIMTPFMVDCLQSKCYALPYMNLSVEELVNRGWIKLTPILSPNTAC